MRLCTILHSAVTRQYNINETSNNNNNKCILKRHVTNLLAVETECFLKGKHLHMYVGRGGIGPLLVCGGLGVSLCVEICVCPNESAGTL